MSGQKPRLSYFTSFGALTDVGCFSRLLRAKMARKTPKPWFR